MIIGEPPAPSGAFGVDAIAVTMRFGDFLALDNVELKVRPGSFHALLGENGAGKSTLVKCIMGYYHATEGDIIVGGATLKAAMIGPTPSISASRSRSPASAAARSAARNAAASSRYSAQASATVWNGAIGQPTQAVPWRQNTRATVGRSRNSSASGRSRPTTRAASQ